MYNNLENLLEMIETKHEIDMLIENAIDNMSTRELEMLTEAGGGKVVRKVKDMVLKTKWGKHRYTSVNPVDDITNKFGLADDSLKVARATRVAANKAKDLARLKTAATVGKVAGAGAVLGGVGAAGYGAGNKKGTQKGMAQGMNQGIRIGGELGSNAGYKAGIADGAAKARREILAQIAAEKDAAKKASLIYKAKKIFGVEG